MQKKCGTKTNIYCNNLIILLWAIDCSGNVLTHNIKINLYSFFNVNFQYIYWTLFPLEYSKANQTYKFV